MTTILKFRKGPINKVDVDNRPIPILVAEWMKDHPECVLPDLNFHYGFHVFIFHDDVSATEFKLRFRDVFDEASKD